MLHPLEHVRDHQNPLADTPALASCQAPQLGRPRFAAKKVCRHTPSPKHGTLANQLYHIWGSPKAGISSDLQTTGLPWVLVRAARRRRPPLSSACVKADNNYKFREVLRHILGLYAWIDAS